MKTILSLSLVIFVGLTNVAMSDDNQSAAEVARDGSTDQSLSNAGSDQAKIKIDIYPTWSLSGIPRITPYIAGETLFFSTRITLTDLADKKDFDCTVLRELFDADGNVVAQLPDMPIDRKAFVFGGNTYTERFGFSLEDPKPGKYRLKYLLVNRTTGERNTREHTIEIQEKGTFGAMNIVFSCTNDRPTPVGANFTVGDFKYLFFWVSGAGVKDDRVHLQSTLTILNSNGQPVDADPTKVDCYKPAPRYNREFVGLFFNLCTTRPGDFILRVELKDCNSDKTAIYDLPIKVLPPPGMDEEKP